VLEKVCKTGPTRRLILRADVIEEVYSNDGRGMIRMKHDREAIFELVFLRRDRRETV
jgi:hypothetical protein